MAEVLALSLFCHTEGCPRATIQGQKFCPVCRSMALKSASERFPKPPTGEKWIYFVRHGEIDGPIKIGVARYPMRRLKDLQVGCPDRVWIEAAFVGDPAIEKLLHAKFAQHHIRGEWFKPCPELNKIISAAKRREERQRADRVSRLAASGLLD